MGDLPVESEAFSGCWMEVVNKYRWVGDPRLGKFKVYVDGKAVGSAPLSGSLRVPIHPGRVGVRVRLWWFASPPVQIDVGTGQTVQLWADIPRELPVLNRMMRMGLHPLQSLSLGVVSASAGGVDIMSVRPGRSIGALRVRETLLAEGLVVGLGFALLSVGVRVSVALAIVGAVLVCLGAGLGVRALTRARRSRDIGSTDAS